MEDERGGFTRDASGIVTIDSVNAALQGVNGSYDGADSAGVNNRMHRSRSSADEDESDDEEYAHGFNDDERRSVHEEEAMNQMSRERSESAARARTAINGSKKNSRSKAGGDAAIDAAIDASGRSAKSSASAGDTMEAKMGGIMVPALLAVIVVLLALLLMR
jgi:hypothetical protein